MERSTAALRRLALEVVGWLLVVGGLAAIPLPGPGLLMLLGGLAILSQRYTWAERRVRPVEEAAMRAASDGVQSTFKIVVSLLGVLWLWGTGILWIVRPPPPSWWPLDRSWWLFGGVASGVTLVLSGFIALALIVYSVRRFRGSPYEPPSDTVPETGPETQAEASAETSAETHGVSDAPGAPTPRDDASAGTSRTPGPPAS